MSSITLVKSMLDEVGLEYDEGEAKGYTTLLCDTSNHTGEVALYFSDKGSRFVSAEFIPGNEGHNLKNSADPNAPNYYEDLLKMMMSAPKENGETIELSTPDGKYDAIAFVSKKNHCATIFVFMASNKQFLGIVGAVP